MSNQSPTSAPKEIVLSGTTIFPLLGQVSTSPSISSFLSSLAPPPSVTGSGSSSERITSAAPTDNGFQAIPLQPQPESIKSFPDTTFQNYPLLGLDLVYVPRRARSAPGAGAVDARHEEEELSLDRVDLYNPAGLAVGPRANSATAGLGTSGRPRRVKVAQPSYSQPRLPIRLVYHPPSLPTPAAGSSATPSTTGREEVGRPAPRAPSARPQPSVQGGNTGSAGVAVFDVASGTTGREFVQQLGEPSRKGGGEGWVGPWLEWDNIDFVFGRHQGGLEASSQAGSEAEADNADTARVAAGTGRHDGGAGIGMEAKRVKWGIMVELNPAPSGGIAGKATGAAGAAVGGGGHGGGAGGGVWDIAADWTWSCVKFFQVHSGAS